MKLTVVAAFIALAASTMSSVTMAADGVSGAWSGATSGAVSISGTGGTAFEGELTASALTPEWERRDAPSSIALSDAVLTGGTTGSVIVPNSAHPTGIHALMGLRTKAYHSNVNEVTWSTSSVSVDVMNDSAPAELSAKTSGAPLSGASQYTATLPIMIEGRTAGTATVPLVTIAHRLAQEINSTTGAAMRHQAMSCLKGAGSIINGNVIVSTTDTEALSADPWAGQTLIAAFGGHSVDDKVRLAQEASHLPGGTRENQDAAELTCSPTNNIASGRSAYVAYDMALFLRPDTVSLAFTNAQTPGVEYTIPINVRVQYL